MARKTPAPVIPLGQGILMDNYLLVSLYIHGLEVQVPRCVRRRQLAFEKSTPTYLSMYLLDSLEHSRKHPWARVTLICERKKSFATASHECTNEMTTVRMRASPLCGCLFNCCFRSQTCVIIHSTHTHTAHRTRRNVHKRGGITELRRPQINERYTLS